VTLNWYDSWAPDVSKGTWAETKTTKIEGEDAELANDARIISCSECSGGKAVGYIGGDKKGTIAFKGIKSSGGLSTINIKYRNGDTGSRYATVSVNGEKQKLAFLSTRHLSQTGVSTAFFDLEEGDNTIVISNDDGWGPDVDALLPPAA